MDDNNEDCLLVLETSDRYVCTHIVFARIYFEDLEPLSMQFVDDLIYPINLN